jgi:hypothetical protein
MRQRGFEPGTQVLFSGLVAAAPEMAEELIVKIRRMLSTRSGSSISKTGGSYPGVILSKILD